MVLMYVIIFAGTLVVSYIVVSDITKLASGYMFKRKLVKNHCHRQLGFKGNLFSEEHLNGVPRTFFTPEESSDFKANSAYQQNFISEMYSELSE